MPLPDAKDYALSRAALLTEGFKGLLLVNGGGAAALLAFIAQVADKSPQLAQLSFVGVAFMAVGLGLALLVPFFRYHHSHAVQKLEAAGRTEGLKTVFWYLYTACQYLSVIAFVGALIYLVVTALPVLAEIPVQKC
ncbi:MAG: hypothetical protein ACLGH1_09210 [Gammaproteobacteria bacterium]|jgi:hypothetical protein|nr:hypothetical protein [Thauera sp.]